MIKRDQYGIIVQHDPANPSYADGGDSAMRTGLMALCGSGQDSGNLARFNIINQSGSPTDLLVRHPYQFPWNNPNNFTRDQLICYMAGAKSTGATNITKRIFKAVVKRGFRAQNTEYDAPGTLKKFPNGPDLLSPSDVLFLAHTANFNHLFLLLLSIAGIPWFLLTLLVATKINPDGEQNQIICQCLTFGRLTTKLYTKLHPNYKKVITDYWGGWRDQREIAVSMIIKVESVVR